MGLHTAKRGRSYRGRIYLPFITESSLSDGSLTGTIASDLQEIWEDFMEGLVTLGVPLVVASYKHATAELVTGTSCLAAVGTQRRRQSRVRYP